jgi:hypothetical protein
MRRLDDLPLNDDAILPHELSNQLSNESLRCSLRLTGATKLYLRPLQVIVQDVDGIDTDI